MRWPEQPVRLDSDYAGALLLVPALVALDLPDAVAGAGLPGTREVPALCSVLSLLALKSIGRRRVSHVDDVCLDPALAAFAGLERHFHGMFVSPSGASDNPFIQVAPGRRFTYHLSIPASHPQGTYWYHDHGMVMSGSMMSMPGMTMPGMTPTATTGATVESQIFAGLSGTIVVGDDRTLLPAALSRPTRWCSKTCKSTALGGSSRTPRPRRSTPTTRQSASSTASFDRS